MCGRLRDEDDIDIGPFEGLGRGQTAEARPDDDDAMTLADSGGCAHGPPSGLRIMGVVIAEVEPPPSGGVAPAASLLPGFASRLDVEAGEVLDELGMSVRQPGDPVQLAAAGHRLFEVDHALQCLLIRIKGALTGFLG